MVEEKGEMNVKRETRIVATHFRCHDQFMGLSGSFGPSQDICLVSERDSCCGGGELSTSNSARFSASYIGVSLFGVSVEAAGEAIFLLAGD